MIVTDRSGSMLADGRRAEPARGGQEGGRHVPRRVPDKVRVGAVAFNQKAEVLQSPTRDHDAVREALQSVKAAGSTATGDAINAALDEHQGQGARRDRAALRRQVGARQRPARRGAGGQGAQDPDLHGRARHRRGHDQRRRARAARPADARARSRRSPAARAFTAGDVKSLDQVYKRLGSQVATEKRKLEVTNLFAGGALALMALSALSSIRMFGRVL